MTMLGCVWGFIACEKSTPQSQYSVCLPVSGGASGRNLITDIYSALFFFSVIPSRHSQSADQIRSRGSQGLTRADYPLTNVFICTSSSAISRAFRKLSRHVVSCSCPSTAALQLKSPLSDTDHLLMGEETFERDQKEYK